MPPADPRTAAPGAICPPVPDLPGGQASVSGFADVDGIPGASTAAGHRDEIDIVTLHWCVTNQTGPPGGGGGGAGRAVFDGVVIGKHTDLATVPLVEAAATGRHIERVVITLERGTKPFPFLVVELEDVVVTRVNSSWSGGLPDEEVAFAFGGICWEYRRSPGATPVRFCFDLRSSSPS